MPKKSKSKTYSSTPSPFQKEIQALPKTIGIVMGKGGSTLKSFNQMPGIAFVKCTSNGQVQIHGDSQQAVETVATSIEQLIAFSLDKNSGYFPDFFAFCLCKSLTDPLLAINKLAFETFSNEISNLSGRDIGTRRSFYSLKSGEESCKDSISETPEDVLAEEFAQKLTTVFFYTGWDFSAYREKLRSCLEPLLLCSRETLRSINLVIRFGKQLFFGSRWSELQKGDFMSITHLQDLCRREQLDQRFSTACTDSAMNALRLHLQTLGYQNSSIRKKITVHVADLNQRQLQYNVSIRCEGLNESIKITRVRTQPKRHGFVIFCREGSCRTDFRLGVISHGNCLNAIPEMVEWIDKAWRNRTPEGLLVFDPPGRFLVMNIRYKDAETYLSEDWKLRIAQMKDGARNNKISKRGDCVLSSRWFKSNVHKLAEDDNNLDQALEENVEALIKEGAKISHIMDAN